MDSLPLPLTCVCVKELPCAKCNILTATALLYYPSVGKLA